MTRTRVTKEVKMFFDTYSGRGAWWKSRSGLANFVADFVDQYISSHPEGDGWIRKDYSNPEIIELVKQWFEENWHTQFTSKPDDIRVGIDQDDYIMVYGCWMNGDKDFAGLGNKYKFLYFLTSPPKGQTNG